VVQRATSTTCWRASKLPQPVSQSVGDFGANWKWTEEESRLSPTVAARNTQPARVASGVNQYVAVFKNWAHSRIGLNIDFMDGANLIISVVKSGIVEEWNKTATECNRIRKGDMIIEVNGIRVSRLIVETIQRANPLLRMVLQRPEEVKVLINKVDAPLGLEVTHTDNGSSLLVLTVGRGPVHDWNQAHEDLAVGTNDRIVAVNGTMGPCSELLKLIAARCVSELLFFRYAEYARGKSSCTTQGESHYWYF